MSNSGAVVPSSGAGGGSAVQLSADVTGITQFLLNLGLAGFKHHALAGVDTHTVLSMLAIAEVCPASMQCRVRLSQRRNEQRQQSVWLYKVVEVGAGTNFIVDQLLQTRAAAFNTATLYVFEKRNVPPNGVPGLAQLEKFRETILPLASKMDIKDKVFQYHEWMTHLLEAEHSQSQRVGNTNRTISPHTAMPDPETVANVICYLSKLVEEQDEVFVLVYHGLVGAAWIAVYAQDVLALPVCIFVNENSAVPLSGDHLSARVILRLYSNKQTCELRRVGKVEDFIKIQSTPVNEAKGWIVDARTTKYYSPQRSSSKNSNLDHIYATLAGPLTCDYVTNLALSLNGGSSDDRWIGTQRFAVARLPLLQKRALANMQILGFDCTAESAQEMGTVLHLLYSKRRAPSGFQTVEPSFGNALLDSHHDPDATEIQFNADGQDAIDFLLKAVNFAATMAFTNWGRTFRGMSVSYLASPWRESWLSTDSRPLPYRDLKCEEWRDPMLEILMARGPPTGFDTSELLRYALYLSTNTVEHPDIRRFLDPINALIATSCEGLVLVRTMSIPDSGALQQIELLSFHPGAIICEGESLTSIKSENSGLEISAELVTSNTVISPSNAVPDLKVVSRSLIERHEVLVETQIMLGTECCQLADPVAISEMIPQLLVSDHCPHGYGTQYKIPQRIKTINKRNDVIYHSAPVWQGGLSFESKHRPASMRMKPDSTKVYVQSVDQNPQGQWLACQWTSDWEPSAMILQEGSCLECIFENAKNQSFVELCIINGGTGTKSRPHSTSQLRAPSQHHNRSSSAPSHGSSIPPQGSSTVQRYLSVDDDGGQGSSDDRSAKSQSPLSFEAMGVPASDDVPKKSRKMSPWSKQKGSDSR